MHIKVHCHVFNRCSVIIVQSAAVWPTCALGGLGLSLWQGAVSSLQVVAGEDSCTGHGHMQDTQPQQQQLHPPSGHAPSPPMPQRDDASKRYRGVSARCLAWLGSARLGSAWLCVASAAAERKSFLLMWCQAPCLRLFSCPTLTYLRGRLPHAVHAPLCLYASQHHKHQWPASFTHLNLQERDGRSLRIDIKMHILCKFIG